MPRKNFFRYLALAAAAAALACLTTGCARDPAAAWGSLANRAFGYGFHPTTFHVSPFYLAGLVRGEGSGAKELVVYLEGDGRGVVRGRVSLDPTPNNAMGFELAKSDPAPAVLYLARVGQFQPSQTGPAYMAYWSDKRLAEECVDAAGRAIDEAKLRVGAKAVHLVGYSGGGGLAVLLAARRADVASLTTVAGLLDTYWWVRQKRYRPMVGSLNPADCAEAVKAVPQLHFYGTEDTVIPPEMSAHFKTLAQFGDFKRLGRDTNHWTRWPEMWPGLLTDYVLPLRRGAAAAR